MRQDAWRAYAEIVLGMTEASRKRATKVAKQFLGKGGGTAEQVQAFADELFKAGVANREQLTQVVRSELDRALARVGLAKADEVATLESRVRDLEAQLATRETTAAAQKSAEEARVEVAAATGVGSSIEKAPVKTVAKKTVAKKAVVAKKAPGSAEPLATVEVVPPATAATGTTAKTDTTAKISPVKKTVAKKAVAKKTTAGPASAQLPAKKVAARKSTGGAQ
jgi:polyhydroxyalkanoate synthesis regulator phasin